MKWPTAQRRPRSIRNQTARSVVAALLLYLASAGSADSGVTPTAEQIKAINRRYEQVEEQLPRSRHYQKREDVDGINTVTKVWFNGTGDLLKVTTEHVGPQGRELTESVAIDPDLTDDGLFVLTRKETPAPDGGTQVEETRRYYGDASTGSGTMDNGVLIRELKKSAHFASGEPLDMSKVPNTTVAVPKPQPATPSTEEEQKVRFKIFEEPGQIAHEMQAAGAPETDPLATTPGDSDRFHLVHGSASPDGRYGLAIGFDQPTDWSKYADHDFEDQKDVYTAEDAEDLRNYIVDLTNNRIVGPTGGSYFGTRRRYNHRECFVSWARDSSTFVEVYSGKWSYESCHAGRITAGLKLSAIDLGKPAEKYAATFLKSKGQKYRGNIALAAKEVAPDGTIQLEIYGQSPSVPNKGEVYFHLEETLRLRETAAGLQLQFVKARLLPNE